MNGPRNDAYLTAIVALGHIAYLMPEKYPVQIKNVVARNIVKQLLMKEVTEVCKILRMIDLPFVMPVYDLK